MFIYIVMVETVTLYITSTVKVNSSFNTAPYYALYWQQRFEKFIVDWLKEWKMATKQQHWYRIADNSANGLL